MFWFVLSLRSTLRCLCRSSLSSKECPENGGFRDVTTLIVFAYLRTRHSVKIPVNFSMSRYCP